MAGKSSSISKSTSYCRTHLLEAYCKESNISDAKWLKQFSSYSTVNLCSKGIHLKSVRVFFIHKQP